MKIITIPKKVLPLKWKDKIKDFNIDKSSLPKSLKPLCFKIQKNILENEENAATSHFNRPFIKHVCLEEEWTLDIYEELPLELIEEVFNELGSQKGVQYDTKLYSLFSELYAYKHLVLLGYKYKKFERSIGSCDLILQKDGVEYNCEVKLKKSKDNYHIGILYYILGKAWLSEYSDLRKLDIVYYAIIKYPKNYSDTEKMYKEIDTFCKSPKFYKGEYIHLSHKERIHREPSDYIISQYTKKSTKGLIEKILAGKDRHLTKLIEKSSKFDNFIGYISLNIPFHNDIQKSDLENVFESLEIDFKLYVDVNGMGIEEPYVFEVN